VATTDPNGRTTRFEYDAEGNRSAVINALGERFTLRFTASRLPTEMVDPNGNSWQRLYDVDNHLIATREPDGAAWHYRYDAHGCLVEITDPAGAVQRLQYQSGQLTAGSDWQGNVCQYYFDPFGRLTGRVDPLGGLTRFEYDVWGNLALHRSADGSVRRMQYDAVGNLLRYIDSDGSVTRMVYGPCRRLLRKIEPDGSEIRHTWSSEPEELETIVNEREEVYRYKRDAAGRLTEEIGFDGRSIRYRRDPAGEIASETNGNGEVTQFTWDALGRLSGKTLPDGAASRYEYDALGNMVRATNGAADLRFEHDAAGRLIREFQDHHAIEHRYNPAGHRIGLATTMGPRIDFSVDANGDRTGIHVGAESVVLVRNALGLEVEQRLPNGVTVTQAHDPTGRLTSQDVRRAFQVSPNTAERVDAQLMRRRYAYGSTGLLWTLHDDHSGERQYKYDARQRPTDVMSQGDPLEHYELGATDDLLQATLRHPHLQRDDRFAYAGGGRLRERGVEQHVFDAQGRLIARHTGPPDAPQDLWTYEWNADDLLVALTRPDGRSWRYSYDALGRRISKEEVGGERVSFIWTGNKLLHEVHAESTTTWLFGEGDLAPAARLDADGLAAVITDHIGTPVATARRGDLLREAVLTARGVVAMTAERPCDMPWRFQGQYADAESGLYYSRFRYYSPDTGAFISQDPLRAAGGYNLYSYATDPVNFIDPYGLSTSSDSRKLGKNLENAGQPKQGTNDDAHHIVMSNSTDKDMKKLQAYMKKNDIDINDPRNGIWLPRKVANRGKDGDTRTAHKGQGLHSKAYKKYVYNKLMAGSPPPPSKREFLARLAAVKKELAQGKTFKCKG
jgi:RHS repeat-associated protein